MLWNGTAEHIEIVSRLGYPENSGVLGSRDAALEQNAHTPLEVFEVHFTSAGATCHLVFNSEGADDEKIETLVAAGRKSGDTSLASVIRFIVADEDFAPLLP